MFAIAEDAICGGSYEDAVDVARSVAFRVCGMTTGGIIGSRMQSLKHDARARKRKEPRRMPSEPPRVLQIIGALHYSVAIANGHMHGRCEDAKAMCGRCK